MPQPDYVPLFAATKVRSPEQLPVPDAWLADRPAEISGVLTPSGPHLGRPGPDQGYGLKLVRQLEPRFQLTAGENAHDVMTGCVDVGLARAALFGRAPVIYDMELACGVWGFLDTAPPELVAFRVPLFRAASHNYWGQRDIVDRVPAETLRLTPDEARKRLNVWRTVLTAD